MDQNTGRNSGFESAELCLQWRHHHNTLVSILDTLWERQELVDVTLTAEGQSVQVHRIILCACSQYFQELLTQRQYIDKHAIIFLKDVDFSDLEALVQYMYKGEVRISEEQLASFLNTAKSLGIRGIMNSTSPEESRADEKTAKRRRLSDDTAEDNDIVESQDLNLPLPPPLKHMTSLTKIKDVHLPEASETHSGMETTETVWRETTEELDEAEPLGNQYPNPSAGHWSQDSGEIQAGSGNSHDESSSVQQEISDWAGASSTVDNTVLYSLLLQSCGASGEAAAGTPNDSGEEEFAENPQDDPGESSDQETPSNEHLDQVAAQAIVPNRRNNSKKDSSGRRPLYSCNRCGRIYSKKHSVLRHLRYECGVEPQFQCSICNHRFKHRSDLQRHERKIHGVEPAVYDEEEHILDNV